MKLLKLILITGIIVALSPVSSFAQQNRPTILAAVAPDTFPPIARAVAQARGDVIIEVKIDMKGNVVSTSVTSGHKLLHSVSEKAAKRWRFSPVSDASKIRTTRLIFTYSTIGDADQAEGEFRTIFMPPNRVEIRYKPPVISWVNGTECYVI